MKVPVLRRPILFFFEREKSNFDGTDLPNVVPSSDEK